MLLTLKQFIQFDSFIVQIEFKKKRQRLVIAKYHVFINELIILIDSQLVRYKHYYIDFFARVDISIIDDISEPVNN